MEKKKNYLIDMDGVLVRGRTLIPGADTFIEALKKQKHKFLILTNNPLYTQRDLAHRLSLIGLEIAPDQIFTSAMATARFLHSQNPNGTAFALGESGLTQALHDMGFVLTDINPDYVVLGEVNTYNMEQFTKAIRLVVQGAAFIATNPDANGPDEAGVVPACGAMAALIEKASGRAPFFIGKPNPLMMRTAMNYLGVHSENTVMIGDRMDTDIVAGVMAGLETILVLSGVTGEHTLHRYPYKPSRIVNSIADLQPERCEE
ncbi:HAD-IIA family hydrolase [Leptolinea tardivitalis]|uniref:HAD family hydrolase n=1 Tax=Leptolinea tardivitalis TaxID=229920 RepID=A0A0N8GKR9_9CHLR|nr:HAD-IIA family hydrolase [Leptolinea tardivitalis]KPL70466.1 HAD family hydrolase [Leptolinea tardivitalis]GAP22054.1 predicted sugar phosphatases of the HAD superfamily [Leptolinea tardivitalis]